MGFVKLKSEWDQGVKLKGLMWQIRSEMRINLKINVIIHSETPPSGTTIRNTEAKLKHFPS